MIIITAIVTGISAGAMVGHLVSGIRARRLNSQIDRVLALGQRLLADTAAAANR